MSLGITKGISWGTKSGSSLLIAVGEHLNDPRILVHASNVVKAVTGRGRCAVIWASDLKIDTSQGVPSSDHSIVGVDLRRAASLKAEYITSGVVVPRMIRLHTIADMAPVNITTHLEMAIHIEMNIRDTAAQGMTAIMRPLRPHLQREIIGGL